MDNSAGVLRWDLEVVRGRFTAGLASALGEVRIFGSSIQKVGKLDLSSSLGDLNNFTSQIVQTTSVLGALGGVLGGVFINSAADLQKSSTSFQVLIGNTETANKLFGQLAQFANNTPFEFPQIAQAGRTLLGFGVQAQDVQTVISQLGDIAGATGGDLGALSLVTGQIFAQGKVQAQDFYQIINSGAGSLGPLIAKNLGVNGVGALRKKFDEGKVTAQAFFDALQQATAQGGFAFEGTNKLAQTFSGRLSTLKDQLLETGRNLLGVRVDPALGLTVKPGGVFDQLTQLLPKISAGAAVLGPLLERGFNIIIQNGPAIIGVIAGIGAAFAAFKLLGAGLSLVTLLAKPATLIFAGIAVILGVVVFGAVQRLIPKLKELFGNLGAGTKNAADEASKALKAVGSNQKGLGSQTDQLAASLVKSNRDYKQSLADIVKAHATSISDIKRQTADEVASFEQAQAKRTAAFQKNQTALQDSHAERTAQIQADIDTELKKGRLGDRSRVADLRMSLAKENADFTKSSSEKQADYQQETDTAQAEYQKRLTALQLQLDTETAFQQKHAADLRGIRAEDALDEVQRIKQSHDDQLISFRDQEAQKQAITATSIFNQASEINKLPSLIDQAIFDKLGNDVGRKIGIAFKEAVLGSLNDLYSKYEAFVIGKINPLINNAAKGIVDAFGGSGEILFGPVLGKLGKALKLPGFASGVQNFGGGLAFVGEKGPELVELPGGSNVYSNQETRGMMGSSISININLSGIHTRSQSDVRELGKTFISAVNDELRARGIPEIGNGALSGVTARG